MSLLDNAFEAITIINKVTVSDGYGGVVTTWTDGAEISGAITFDTSIEMRIAQAMGVTANYTLTVRKVIDLDYHTVIRRESDKKIFRVTSNGDDNKTPPTAGLDMKQYSLEEWKLT